jgi:murein DD-endopeptidase MepM/ murein hydrolase activator NlpD
MYRKVKETVKRETDRLMNKRLINISLLVVLALVISIQASAGIFKFTTKKSTDKTITTTATNEIAISIPVKHIISPPIVKRITEEIKFPIDTLDTDDKYTKIVLYDNRTWSYIDLGRPTIDSTSIFKEYWDTEVIHAYRKYPKDSIPQGIDLLLADENNHYCAPIIGKVYSGYKFRRSREHTGLDIPLHIGDTIRATFDGVVRYTGSGKKTGGYGHLIILRHSNGLETYYGHLSKIFVKTNEPVKAGDIIGLGGNTGRSTGPHLHFEVRYKGQTFDPERLIDFSTGALKDSLFTIHKHYFSIYSNHEQTDDESKAAAGRQIHTIRSGDTLGKLANRYGTTVSAICRLNGISSKKVLRIGERIIVR